MTTVCHLWPSVTPWNIWDLPYGVWVGFAAETDAYLKDPTSRQFFGLFAHPKRN